MSINATSSILNLPTVLTKMVGEYLTAQDLGRCFAVSKLFHRTHLYWPKPNKPEQCLQVSFTAWKHEKDWQMFKSLDKNGYYSIGLTVPENCDIFGASSRLPYNLKVIELYTSAAHLSWGLGTFVPYNSDVRKLCLTHKVMPLHETQLFVFLNLFTQIQVVDLSFFKNENVDHIFKNRENIRSLHLSNCTISLKNFPKLESLKLAQCTTIKIEEFDHLAGSNLQELDLTGCTQFTSEELGSIACKFPQLKKLNLSNTHFGQQTLQTILLKFPKLELTISQTGKSDFKQA